MLTRLALFVFRLSSVAGERLRFNNPAIADLSDENRPNKLAEKFSELYDNEWTEFYEKLEGLESTEEEKIGQIVQILQVCNIFKTAYWKKILNRCHQFIFTFHIKMQHSKHQNTNGEVKI